MSRNASVFNENLTVRLSAKQLTENEKAKKKEYILNPFNLGIKAINKAKETGDNSLKRLRKVSTRSKLDQ